MLAQPPVSRQIALLEDELGVCLFLRTNKGIELTEAGQSLYVQNKHIFQSMHTMIDSVRTLTRGWGCLKLGSIYSTISFTLDFLKKYHAEYPNVEYYIRMGTPWGSFERSEQWRSSRDISPGTTSEISGSWERILGEETLEVILTESLDPAPGLDYIPIERLPEMSQCACCAAMTFGATTITLLMSVSAMVSLPMSSASVMIPPWLFRWYSLDLELVFCSGSIEGNHLSENALKTGAHRQQKKILIYCEEEQHFLVCRGQYPHGRKGGIGGQRRTNGMISQCPMESGVNKQIKPVIESLINGVRKVWGGVWGGRVVPP